jgi:hypothetical protein
MLVRKPLHRDSAGLFRHHGAVFSPSGLWRWIRGRRREREFRAAKAAATTLEERLALNERERRRRRDEILRSGAEHEEKMRRGWAKIERRYGRYRQNGEANHLTC